MTPLWRQAFDAVERPLAAVSESWVQSETFMDLTAVAFRLQRRLTNEVQHATEQWLSVCGLPSHGDLARLMNQVGSLERELRELTLKLDTERRAARPRGERAPAQKAA